jgi:hypothetical protein
MASSVEQQEPAGSTLLAKLADIALRYGVGAVIAFYVVYVLATITTGNINVTLSLMREHILASKTIEQTQPAIVALLQELCLQRTDTIVNSDKREDARHKCTLAALGFKSQ